MAARGEGERLREDDAKIHSNAEPGTDRIFYPIAAPSAIIEH